MPVTVGVAGVGHAQVALADAAVGFGLSLFGVAEDLDALALARLVVAFPVDAGQAHQRLEVQFGLVAQQQAASAILSTATTVPFSKLST